MMRRCYNKADSRYIHYGARGIAVCERWRLFANFQADMGEKPDGLTLDRIDNDGNYEADNCRWVDYTTQNYNKRAQHNNRTGQTGVHFNNRLGKYMAYGHKAGKKFQLYWGADFSAACAARQAWDENRISLTQEIAQ